MELTAAFWDYDRTRALASGAIAPPGIQLACTILRPEECFARSARAEFDITELSFSNTLTAISQGEFPYHLIPVFPSRAFRHSALFVRTDRGIDNPRDLAGKTIGLAEYDMTAAVVVRGLLRDEYGVDTRSIRWLVGDRVRTKPLDFPVMPKPADLDMVVVDAGRSLDERILGGEVDALIALRPPLNPAGLTTNVRPLFPEPARAEQDYFRRTGLFPIMHAIGVRKTLVADRPDLPSLIFQAFCAAKRAAVAELEVLQAAKVTLPWVRDALKQTREILGEDYWPYGFSRNRPMLETQMRWSREDGLQARPLSLEEVFPSALED